MRHPALQVLLIPLLLGSISCISYSSDGPASPASTTPAAITDGSQLTGFGDITDETVLLWDEFLRGFNQTNCIRGWEGGAIEKYMGRFNPETDRYCVEFYFWVDDFEQGDCFPTGRYGTIDMVKDTLGEFWYPDFSFGFKVSLSAQTARTCALLGPVYPDDKVRVRAVFLEAVDGWAYLELVWVGDKR